MQFSVRKRCWVLTGIISYGYRCALRDYAVVYTRISVYVEWIKLIVGKDDVVTVDENAARASHTCNAVILGATALFRMLALQH